MKSFVQADDEVRSLGFAAAKVATHGSRRSPTHAAVVSPDEPRQRKYWYKIRIVYVADEGGAS